MRIKDGDKDLKGKNLTRRHDLNISFPPLKILTSPSSMFALLRAIYLNLYKIQLNPHLNKGKKGHFIKEDYYVRQVTLIKLFHACLSGILELIIL